MTNVKNIIIDPEDLTPLKCYHQNLNSLCSLPYSLLFGCLLTNFFIAKMKHGIEAKCHILEPDLVQRRVLRAREQAQM